MPIRSKWLNDDKRVIVAIYEDPWTWDEYYAANAQAAALAATVNHEVDYIVDFRGAQVVPSNALTHLSVSMRSLAEANSVVVMTGVNAMWRAVGEMLAKIHPVVRDIILFADNEEEACAAISTRRGSVTGHFAD